MDDVLDDAHWINVQDPIKQMFVAITKAIRNQSAGIRDVDKRCDNLVTPEALRRAVKDVIDQCCSKEAATQLIYQIDTKTQAIEKLDKLCDNLSDQSVAIANLNNRLDSFEFDLNRLKNPNYDQIFNYIDRQVGNLATDTDRKLSFKAEQRDVETVIPHRIEELYRNLLIKVNEMSVDIAKAATKEEFQLLAHNKAEGSEIRELSAELSDRVTRHELHQSVMNSMKPLTTALSSLEKALQVQDSVSKQYQTNIIDKVNYIERVYDEKREKEYLHNEQHRLLQSNEYIRHVIDDVVREKSLNEVNHMVLESALTSQYENVMKQMNILGEAIRLEIVSSNREEFNQVNHHIINKIEQITNVSNEISTKHMKTRKAVKELSLNVANALSKKLDVKDFKRVMKQQQLDSATSADDTTAVTTQQSRYHNIINTSQRLSNTKDASKEFDYLLQNMREKQEQDDNDDDNIAGNDDVDNNNDVKAVLSSDSHHSSGSGRKSPTVGNKKRSGSDTEDSLNYSRSHLTLSNLNTTSNKSGLLGKSPIKSALKNTSNRLNSSRISSTSSTGMLKKSQITTGTVDINYRQLVKDVEQLKENIHAYHRELSGIRESLIQLQSVSPSNNRNANPLNTTLSSTLRDSSIANITAMNDMERLDWKIALGEVSMNIRRELSEKASREEMYSVLRGEVDNLQKNIHSLQQVVDNSAPLVELTRVDNEVNILKNKVAGELTGARFLWTSGHLLNDGWIPWDMQVINAAPSAILWKKNTSSIKIKIPGLYRFSVAVFTSTPTILQVYLNDEPIFSYQPEQIKDNYDNNGNNTVSAKSDSYYLRRLRHSVGEVSSICIDEHVSLPADANIMIRYHSQVPAQAFFSIKKI